MYSCKLPHNIMYSCKLPHNIMYSCKLPHNIIYSCKLAHITLSRAVWVVDSSNDKLASYVMSFVAI